MNAAKSWSIKGVDEGLREAAKRAAQSQGKTLGEWMNDMIRREAGVGQMASGTTVSAGGAQETAGAGMTQEEIVRRLDELGAQLRALAAREQQTAAGRIAGGQGDTERLAEVIARIEQNERNATHALEEINARLDELARQLEQSQAAGGVAPGYGELEAALRNVMRHMEHFEQQTGGAFQELRQRMEEVAAQAAAATAAIEAMRSETRTQGTATAEVRQLEERLETLAANLARLREEAETQARTYVDSRIGELNERLQAVHQASAELPKRVETLVSDVAGRRFGEVERQIAGMIASLRDRLERIAEGVIDVDRIGARIEELDRKLAELGERAVRRNEVEALQKALEKLSLSVEAKADRSEVEALAARLDEMASRLEKERAALAGDPDFADLEARIRRLEEELKATVDHMVRREDLEELRRQFGTLGQRLDHAEQQLSYLPQLENSVARLFQSIEATSEETRRIVEETARQFMEEKGMSGGAEAAADQVSSEELAALRQGLEAVRQASQEADARTQETLAAVHETLERIVARLAEIESEQKSLARRTGEMAEKLIDYTTTATAAAASVAAPAMAAESMGAGAAQPQGEPQMPFDQTAAAPGATMPGMNDPMAGAAATTAAGSETPADPSAPNAAAVSADPAGGASPSFAASDILAAINAMEGSGAGQQPQGQNGGEGAGGGIGASPFAPAGMPQSDAQAMGAQSPMPDAQDPFAGPAMGMPQPEGQPGMGSAGGLFGGPGAAQTPQPGMEASAQTPETDDFIAAARRAAMAAAGQAPGDGAQASPEADAREDGGLLSRLKGLTGRRPGKDGDGEGAAADAGGKKKEKGLSAFFRRSGRDASKDAAQGGEAANAANAADGKKESEGGLSRRPLLIAGASLLMAVLAWGYTQMSGRSPAQMFGLGGDTPAVETPAEAEGAGKAEAPRRKGAFMLKEDEVATRRVAAGSDLSGSSRPGLGAGGGRLADPLQTSSVENRRDEPAAGDADRRNAAPADAASRDRVAGERKAQAAGGDLSLPPQMGSEAFRKAALSGDPRAEYLVAVRYLEGRDVPRSPARAAEWLARAAAHGLVPAQYRLGTLYERGLGLKKDLAKARAWYEKAAAAGNVKAMHNLAVILASSERDYRGAARWFRKAAEHGLRDSQYNLAVLYERGLGVPQDLEKAYYWYGVAAATGDAGARQRLETLRGVLEPAQVKRLDREVAAFKARQAPLEANRVAVTRSEWREATASGDAARRVTEARKAAEAKDTRVLKDAASIRRIQQLLAQAGYDPGPVDGKMGKRTANAIRLFQLQMGLKVNGQPTAEVLKLLQARVGGARPEA